MASIYYRFEIKQVPKLQEIAFSILLSCALTSCTGRTNTVNLRGNYYWGHEVESIHPCGSGQSFWVMGSDSVLEPLRKEAMRLAQERGQPYQPVYIEGKATAEDKQEDGFAADYDGVYRLTSIKALSSSIPSNCTGE